MRETVSTYEVRSQRAYAPPDWVALLGSALADDESCPTLFRYPGPCGVAGLVGRDGAAPTTLGTLAPVACPVAWLADATAHEHARGAVLFGTIAVLRPLAHGVCRAPPFTAPAALRGGAATTWVVANNALGADDAIVWVPPSKLFAPIAWDDVATAAEAAESFGPHVAEEQREVAERLSDYLAELDALRGTGAPAPARPWCEVPEDHRREILARYGVAHRYVGAAL